MLRRLPLGAVLATVPALVSCLGDPTGPVACTAEARAGITVEVLDGITREPIAEGAVLTLREGDYTETSGDVVGGRYLSGAYERAGTYEVRVDRPGYVPWWHRAVTVQSDPCHVVGIELTAFMASLERP